MSGIADAIEGVTGAWILPIMVGLPLIVAIVLVAARRLGDDVATLVAASTATVTFVLAVLASIAAGPYGDGQMGLELDRSWVPALGVGFHFGLDGVSAPLVLLTGLLGVLVCVHSVRVRPAGGRARLLVACYLAVVGGALATFTVMDAVLFFVAFELVLVPMWFAIAFWGDDTQPDDVPGRLGGEAARRDAANRFILFTAVGSALMLVGLLYIALQTGTTDLGKLADLAGEGLSHDVQVVAACFIVFGLSVKAPAFGVHTWLPPAHTIAPTGGSVLLAGVLLKMGTYGLVRVAVPILPDGFRTVAPFLALFAVLGIVWAGLACFVERDLKRLIALSSVAHMGFVLLGIASMTPQGLQGALFANIAHGLITGLLFLTIGSLKDRHHTADLALIGAGLRDRVPRLGWLLAFGAVAGLGLPGLAGFWGELLAIVGTWQSTGPASSLGTSGRPFAVAAIVGTVIAAVYLLRVLRLVWHGAAADAPQRVVPDATRHEMMVAAPLVVATVALGLLPWLLLDLTGPAVRVLLIVSGGNP